MLFKNANIENGAVRASECSTQETADCKAEEGLLDMRVKNGKFAEIGANLTPEDEEKIIDLRGKLVLPPFIESHVHLDTCLTAGEPKWNMSGTLFEGIETWALRKENLT